MSTINSLTLLALISFSMNMHSQTKVESQMLMKSGFEEGVSLSADLNNILGSDVPGFSWTGSPSWISNTKFQYLVHSEPLREYQESAIEQMKGPNGNLTNVLRISNIKDCPEQKATSRNEFSFYGKNAPDDFKEGYVKYWMKLQRNLPDLIEFTGESPNPIQPSQNDQWYMILEWKEINSGIIKSKEECREFGGNAGGSNNYRINIGLQKLRGTNHFNWKIIGEQPQPCRVTEWDYINKEFTVPIDEWFLVEAYMKKHESNGRVYFAVNGNVILDTDIFRPEGFTGRTQHATNPLKLGFWSPLKNYHDMRWNKEGPVSQWYDDFELWSGFPQNHPALKTREN
jgi:hypothetical protein